MSFTSLWNVRREEKSHTKAVSAGYRISCLGDKKPYPYTPPKKKKKKKTQKIVTELVSKNICIESAES